MGLSNFETKVQNNVLQLLEAEPHTMRDLEKKTGFNYSSIRKAVRSLEARGLLRPTGHQLRNTKFTLGTNENLMNNIIPTIISDGKSYKLNILLTFRSKKSLASEAVQALPRNVTRIFNFVKRMHEDESIDFGPQLNNIRWNMEQDLKALTNVVNLYEQILNDHRIWDLSYLKRFVKDYDFDEEQIMEAYNFYFKDE